MKIGLDQYSYHRYFGEIYGAHGDPGQSWSLQDFLHHIRSLPYECLSFETCFLPSSEKTLIEAIRGVSKELSFAWGHPHGFMDTDESTAVTDIEKYLRLSQVFGSQTLRIAASSIAYFHQPHQPQIDLTLRRLERILPLAEKHRVRLAIENHGDFFLPEFEEILNNFNSPFLGLTLDTGNLLRLNEDPVEAIRKLGSKIFLVHAKDLAPIKGRLPDDPLRLACVPGGKGISDFRGIFRALKDQDYQDMILIEISGVHPDYAQVHESEMIREGIHYLKTLRKTIFND
jgi:3-oxoisoapionate decarboxylase